jgi:hypothetical protein
MCVLCSCPLRLVVKGLSSPVSCEMSTAPESVGGKRKVIEPVYGRSSCLAPDHEQSDSWMASPIEPAHTVDGSESHSIAHS